jgi:hypothetical protein
MQESFGAACQVLNYDGFCNGNQFRDADVSYSRHFSNMRSGGKANEMAFLVDEMALTTIVDVNRAR